MLILPAARLVIIEVPKTGTMALRAMLRHEVWDEVPTSRHASIRAVQRRVGPALLARFGQPFETVAVIREPLSRIESWYRYRQREAVAGTPTSSRGIAYDAFVTAGLDPDPPAYAAVGRQDRQVGWNGAEAEVDHLFDYARLDLLVGFLEDRLSQPLVLPRRNVSAHAAQPTDLTDDTLARFRRERAGEIALYGAVAAAGHLRRVSSSAR